MKQERWYTREESETSEKFGTVPEKRPVKEMLEKGLLIVDKPFGPTSKQVTRWIEKELNLEKAGHFGTLDPNATGVLPIATGNATRINNAVSGYSKEYVFEAELGEEFEEEKLRETLQTFLGTNRQMPPEKSAVKQEERERDVHEIELVEKKENRILARVSCEAGFYVRVLVSELGEKLDTDAEMTELRRTRQGDITEDETNTLQEIVDAYHYWKENSEEEKIRDVLKPFERGVRNLRKIAIKDSAVNAVANGADLGTTGISKLQDGITEGETVAITTLKGELVAIAEAEMNSEQMYDQEGTAAELESVHMDPETYPRRWKQ